MSEAIKNAAVAIASATDAINQIGLWVAAYRAGRGPWMKDESLALGRRWGLNLEKIAAHWDEAEDEIAAAAKPQDEVAQPELSEKEIGLAKEKAALAAGFSFFVGSPQPERAEAAEPEPKIVEPEPEAEAEPEWEETEDEDEDEEDGGEAELPGEEEQQALFQELAELYDTDPVAFARRKEEVARRLCVNQQAVHRAAMIVRKAAPRAEEEPELSQASKAVAIGIKQELWHCPDGEGYATVAVAAVAHGSVWQHSHAENYKIKGSGFGRWLRQEYAKKHRIKVGDEWLPQVPGAGALKDALATLESQALFGGPEARPAVRVGGTEEEIWIDLGDPEWRAVRVTAAGWSLVERAGVRFIRPLGMLPLPVPKRGGSIEELLPLLNIRAADFVLVTGWQLQALNPTGSYPLLGVSAASEMGKSTVSRTILGTVDPNRKVLRHRPKTVEDLLVVAKNNHTLGFDNFSWLTAEMSDTLCTLSTGIATGKRANYTDDEETGFVVQRPVLFNGIPAELGSRSDLLSRTIRLQLPALRDEDRRFDADLKAEFVRVWPRVFGALLDGLVAGLVGWRGVEIGKKARLADFEAFAEAGCRGMGFAKGEFERSYRANRDAQMQMNVEGNVVGRQLLQMMKGKPYQTDGFAGKMSALLAKLPHPEGAKERRYWPSDATRLSTQLRQLLRPLEAVGIIVELDVDRRHFGGSQQDVVITWRDDAP